MKKVTYERLIGDFAQIGSGVYLTNVKNHPDPSLKGMTIYTSDVVSYDPKTGIIVTRNTEYHPQD